jgi:hypothetical protein
MLKTITSTRIALLIAVLYLICFQVFLLLPQNLWLCIGNALVFSAVTGYTFYTSRVRNGRMTFPALISMGMRVTFNGSLIAFAGAIVLSLLNFYMFPGLSNRSFFSSALIANSSFSGWRELITLLFANTLLVNLVCGSLASFFTAGLINEKNYHSSRGPLPSVDLYRSVPLARKSSVRKNAELEEYTEAETGWLNKNLVLEAETLN